MKFVLYCIVGFLEFIVLKLQAGMGQTDTETDRI